MTKYSDSTLYISLKNLKSNYSLIQKKLGKAEAAAVVKANAYGLGVKEAALALKKAGSKSFFVATLDEALELREILDKENIYVFHGIRQGQENDFKQFNLIPVLNTEEEIMRWQVFAGLHARALPAIIHVDTGMNRLGVKEDSLRKISEKTTPALDIKYIMSHLISADEKDAGKSKEQLKVFNRARKYFPNTPCSLANSSGIFRAKCYHFQMARPGCALYGVNPTPEKQNPVKPVVRLAARIIDIHNAKKAETVGYGGDFKAKKPVKVATIPVGYSDGYLRSFSNNSVVEIAGRKANVIGRVSMDLITIDVSDIPDNKVYVGAEVELINNNITVDVLAKKAGTIGYEILTSLGHRYKRVYVD